MVGFLSKDATLEMRIREAVCVFLSKQVISQQRGNCSIKQYIVHLMFIYK